MLPTLLELDFGFLHHHPLQSRAQQVTTNGKTIITVNKTAKAVLKKFFSKTGMAISSQKS